MKNFKLTARVTISVYTEVEAKTLEEAIKIAEDRNLMPIIHSGGETAEDTWMCDELDGVAEDIEEA